MDTLAHGLISYLGFGRGKKVKYPLLAVLFGILPDLCSWTIYMFYQFFTNGFALGKPHLTTIPNWVFTLYGISHSIFIFATVILIVYLITKHVPIYLWAWGVHILIDIPTHSREFLPTPFLYPISNWHFPGISWGTSWFMITYWTIILGWLAYVLMKKYRFKIGSYRF